jgi:competence protein ComEC
MRTGCILFACGIVCILHSPSLPPAYLAYFLPLCLILACRFPILRWPMCILCGALWVIFRAEFILQNQISPVLEGEHLIIEGVIVSLPSQSNGSQRFVFDVNKLKDIKGIEYPHLGKIRLSWYKTKAELIPGDSWRFNVKLKRAHGFMNPGGFDYEAWLFQQGIRTTGYINNKAGNRKLLEGSDIYIHRLRYYVREKLLTILNTQDNGSLIPALVTGDRSAIPADRWQVLTATGTSHLLAISGLHIGLIAGLVYFLSRWLWPLGYLTALVLPAPKAASIAAMLAALAYSLMAGFSIPTQRALIMLTLLLVSKLMSREFMPSTIISFALLLVLIIDPFAPLSAGFWLSFSAIIIIAYGMTARIDFNSLWWRWGRVQYIVAIGLTPLLALWFHQVPLTSITANLLVVPWVSFITVPLALSGSILIWLNAGVGGWLLELSTYSIDLFWPVLNELATLDFSVLTLAETTITAFMAAVIGVFLILGPLGLPGRWLGLIFLLPLFFPVPNKVELGEFRLTLLDVGQGLAAVLETRNRTLLFDTGPKYSDNFDAGSAAIVPFLRQRGIKSVDLLVQSHGDNDHIGGLPNVLKAISVKRILTSVPREIQHKNIDKCWSGEEWRWDGVHFEMLHPSENSNLSGNNRSCVLKVSTDERSVLFTGDIESKAENRILKRDKAKMASTVLLAPHHGSLSSSTLDFITAVGPEYVLFPVGYRNRFGFPKQDIIRRYKERGIKIMDTARHGAIEMLIRADDLTIRSYRQYAQRFWHEFMPEGVTK